MDGAKTSSKAWGGWESQRSYSMFLHLSVLLIAGCSAPALDAHYLRALFIHYFLSTYYALGTIIGTRDGNKKMPGLCSGGTLNPKPEEY
jgi:hypothetical protein